jgi:hypothetical protein
MTRRERIRTEPRSGVRLGGHGHLDMNVGPAALEATAAVAAGIVGLNAQCIFSRGGEFRGRGSLSVLRAEGGPVLFKRHIAGTAELAPHDTGRGALPRPGFRRLLAVVRDP